MELVLHYAVNSLEEHNEKLKTTLMYPVGGSKLNQNTLQIKGLYNELHEDIFAGIKDNFYFSS